MDNSKLSGSKAFRLLAAKLVMHISSFLLRMLVPAEKSAQPPQTGIESEQDIYDVQLRHLVAIVFSSKKIKIGHIWIVWETMLKHREIISKMLAKSSLLQVEELRPHIDDFINRYPLSRLLAMKPIENRPTSGSSTR